MTRAELTQYITDHYSAEPEYLWRTEPDFAVFRHGSNRKWFAITMKISGKFLGLPDPEEIDIVNFKADPFFIGSLLGQSGFFPAYHMNKTHWITAALDGSASDDDILTLLDMSFDMTDVKSNGKHR